MSGSDETLLQALEAVLFAAGDPVRLRELAEAVDVEDHQAVKDALDVLAERSHQRGVVLVEVGGRYQLRTHPKFAAAVLRLRGTKPERLSRAALEVLSVVAYQQPVTRMEIDQLRGVDSGRVVRGLIDREPPLLRVAGRRDIPGRPLVYATTPGFLQLFGLSSLRDLPTLQERETLESARQPRLPLVEPKAD